MYDDPPQQENFVNPYYRNHRTPIFKTDHPELSYKNQGHLLNTNRVENLAEFFTLKKKKKKKGGKTFHETNYSLVLDKV